MNRTWNQSSFVKHIIHSFNELLLPGASTYNNIAQWHTAYGTHEDFYIHITCKSKEKLGMYYGSEAFLACYSLIL